MRTVTKVTMEITVRDNQARDKQKAFAFLRRAYDVQARRPSLSALELGKSLGFDDKMSLDIVHYLEIQGFIVRIAAKDAFRLSPAGCDEIAWSLSG
jgi:hypothetical protein